MSGDIEARLNKLRRFSSGGSLRQDYEGTYFIAEEVLAILADAKAGMPSLRQMQSFAPAMTEGIYDGVIRDAMNWRTQAKWKAAPDSGLREALRVAVKALEGTKILTQGPSFEAEQGCMVDVLDAIRQGKAALQSPAPQTPRKRGTLEESMAQAESAEDERRDMERREP